MPITLDDIKAAVVSMRPELEGLVTTIKNEVVPALQARRPIDPAKARETINAITTRINNLKALYDDLAEMSSVSDPPPAVQQV